MVTMEIIAYVLSLAFQVAGAILLIIKYFGNTQKQIIEEYFSGSSYVETDKTNINNSLLKKDKVRECARKVYDNRMAFVFIAAGYILSIFGDTHGTCKMCILAYVFSSTTIIILLEKATSMIISKVIYRKDIPVKRSEIGDKAISSIQKSDIDKMFPEQKKED